MKKVASKADRTCKSGLICLDCIQKSRKETDDMIREFDERRAKEFEWNALSEAEREMRRIAGRAEGFCPRCNKDLNAKAGEPSDKYPRDGSCPMCHEFPSNPEAPMHRVRRILEFASLSESEWRIREKEAIARREANLSTWCVKGDDGVWRRKDNGQAWDVEESKK